MQLTYLGTAASEGWPALFCGCPMCQEARRRSGKDLRLRASALVDDDLLLDLSPDLAGAMQRTGTDLSHVRHVALTHCHGDHFAVAMLTWFRRQFNETAPAEPLRLYGSPMAHRRLTSLLQEASDGPTDHLAFVELSPYETVAVDSDTTLTALPAYHGDERVGAQTYAIDRQGKRLVYLHDTRRVTDEMLSFLRDRPASIVSADATIGPIPPAPGQNHMGFTHLLDIRRRMLECGAADERTIFLANHICIHACYDHRTNAMLFHEDMVRLVEPQGLRVAYDGLRVVCE